MKLLWAIIGIPIALLVLGVTVRKVALLFEFAANPIEVTLVQISATWSGVSEGLAVALPVVRVAASAMGVVLAGAVLLLSIPLVASLFRPRFVVFVSYHHERAGELDAVCRAVEAAGAQARFVPYRTEADHDQLIDKIQRLIEESHLVVCLPGGKKSFLDAEVFAATFARKFLVFLVEFPHGSLPDTAQRSFPVFRRRLSELGGHTALGDLISFIEGRPRAVLRTYLLPSAPHPRVAMALGLFLFGSMAICMAAMVGALLWGMAAYILGDTLADRTQVMSKAMGFYLVMFAVTALTFGGTLALLKAAGAVTSAFRHLMLVKVLRRTVIDGQYTFHLLKRALGAEGAINRNQRPPPWARRVLASMWRRPPHANYQRQQNLGDVHAGDRT